MRTIPSPELDLWRGQGAREFRVRVRRPEESAWQNLSAILGGDWTLGIRTDGDTPDQPAGRFTLRFLKHATEGTVSPGIEASSINLDAASAYRPLLHPGRSVEVDVRVDAEPWRLWLQGEIEDVEWPEYEVVATCATLDQVVQDAQIEAEEESGAADPGTPLEDEIQALLDRWMDTTAPTLRVVGTPDLGIGVYRPGIGSLGEHLRTLAQRIGWDLRYLWSEADSDFRYTLYLPPRDKTAADWEFGVDEVFAVPGLRRSRQYVRNAFPVTYGAPPALVTVEDTASIAEYRRRAMPLTEPELDLAQATALAEFARSDLSQPLVDARYRLPFLPWIELHDLIVIQADNDHFDFDTTFAVVGVSHQVDAEGGAWTEVDVRGGAPAGAFYSWHSRPGAVAGTEGGPAVAVVPKLSGTAATASANVVGNDAVRSIRVAASTSGYPDEATVDAATAIDGQSVPAATVGTLLSGLAVGDVVYFAAKGYSETGGAGTGSALTKADAVFGVDTVGVQDGAVTTPKIGDAAVVAAKLAADAVTRTKILDGAVNDLKLATAAVTNAKLALAAVDTANLVNAAVSEAKLATAAVTTTKIADDSITTPKLVALAITAEKIAAGAVVAGKLSAGAIDATSLIANGIITNDLIAAGTITGAKIAALTIAAGNIAALTITGDKISANAITADKISVSSLSAITADLGEITAGQIHNAADTVGIRISGSVAGGWAHYLNLNGSGYLLYSSVGGDRKFSVDYSGNAFFKGEVQATSGTFAGSLSGATGTFAGSLSAATGTFAGILSAATGTFEGALSAATGTFAGDLAAQSQVLYGKITLNGSWFGTDNTAGSLVWEKLPGSTMRLLPVNIYSGSPSRLVFQRQTLASAWVDLLTISTNSTVGVTAHAAFTAESTLTAAQGITVSDSYAVEFGGKWAIRKGTDSAANLDFLVSGTPKFYFADDGTGYADTAWSTFSPKPPRPADEMTAAEWIAWGAEDARKPVKPYEGLPTSDHPHVVEEARRTRKGREGIAARERERYGKDVAKIAIGTARFCDLLLAAIDEAEDLPDLRRRLGAG